MQINNKQLTLDEARMLLTSRQRNTTRVFRRLSNSSHVAIVIFRWYWNIVKERSGEVKNVKEVATAIREIADFLTDGSRKWGLMFMGNLGTGKTILVRALQKSIVTLAYQDLLPAEAGLRLVHAKDIHRTTNNGMTFKSLCDEPLLAIDDLGDEAKEEMVYGTVMTPVIDLLEYRYDRQLFTIITTNLSADMIRDKYGKRIADRCREMFKVITFKNKSYR